MSVLAWRLASAERLVAAGSLTECKAAGDKRVCDGAVTKELKSTTPSVQVMLMRNGQASWSDTILSMFCSFSRVVVRLHSIISDCRFVIWANSRSRI